MNVSVDGVIQLEEGWSAIKEAIDKLVQILSTVDEDSTNNTAPFSPTEYVQVYTKCYNMCTQRSPNNWAEQLYTRHGETIRNYLVEVVVPKLQEKRDEFLLKEMCMRWQHHEVMDKWMRKFFMYLDRYHVKHYTLSTLHEASLEKFRTLVFSCVSSQFVASILAQINKERDGEVVDRDLLKQCVAVFGNMADKLVVYVEELEAPLLDNTTEFYKKKSQDWIAQDTLPAYLIKAEQALETERERVDNYLEANTKDKLQKVCEKELLQVHESTLLEKEGSGCRYLLANDKKEDLERLYKLYSNVENGLVPIANIVRDHICKMGMEIVEKRETALATDMTRVEKEALDPTFVQSLLNLHEKYDTLIGEQFMGHALFQKALKEAFEQFVNTDTGKTSNAELISSFCDRILKTGGAKLSDDKVEEYLEKCVRLFSYLSDKDLFSEVYRNQLSKRLLMGRSASSDAETSMIGKLKLACGAQFTSKVEGMIKDLLMGDDFKKVFKDQVRSSTASVQPEEGGPVEVSASSSGDFVLIGGVEFSVEVLTTGHWPTPKQIDILLPPCLTQCMAVYKTFYDSKTSHRCLKWVPSLGSNVLKAHFKRTYDLQVTTLQAVTLLHFNSLAPSEWLDFNDIVSRLTVDEEVCKRIMHSLSCGKYKVIIKEPASKKVDPADKFKVNESFASNMRKLRIPMASLEETHNPKRVEEDRSIAIEAAIVRIMKARKHLAHTQLVAEVIQQLIFFKPNPRTVKRRIEHLIDREYLERDVDQPNHYKYLA